MIELWIDCLSRNHIMYKLYDNIPELINVRVEEFSFLESGNKIKIIFDLPVFADYPPLKWKECNTISVELNFWNITDFEFKNKFLNSSYICSILITNENALKITLFGSINCEFKAEFGMIQKIHAYCT